VGAVKRVLIVDDDPNVVEVIAANLEAEGYQVETAVDGGDAWERLIAEPPDLVVLDWMLPGRNGLDLLADLRRHPQTRHIPVVLLTAKARDEEIWAGWQAGADYYLTKPFKVEQLLYYLEQLIA
jgi:DNA-binding response OmpR family regulator